MVSATMAEPSWRRPPSACVHTRGGGRGAWVDDARIAWGDGPRSRRSINADRGARELKMPTAAAPDACRRRHHGWRRRWRRLFVRRAWPRREGPDRPLSPPKVNSAWLLHHGCRCRRIAWPATPQGAPKPCNCTRIAAPAIVRSCGLRVPSSVVRRGQAWRASLWAIHALHAAVAARPTTSVHVAPHNAGAGRHVPHQPIAGPRMPPHWQPTSQPAPPPPPLARRLQGWVQPSTLQPRAAGVGRPKKRPWPAIALVDIITLWCRFQAHAGLLICPAAPYHRAKAASRKKRVTPHLVGACASMMKSLRHAPTNHDNDHLPRPSCPGIKHTTSNPIKHSNHRRAIQPWH